MVQNISGWFPEITAGWTWDDGLPEKRLSEILADSPADLILTRPGYEAYAAAHDGQVFDLLYLRGDGHFNSTGHVVTAQVLYDWLLKAGLVTGG